MLYCSAQPQNMQRQPSVCDHKLASETHAAHPLRWFYPDYEPKQRSAADAALPVVVGVQLMQILPITLAARALHFPAFALPNQVS